KRIAIVGAGSAGLGALAALQTLPEDLRSSWTIDLFEERRGLGGIWLPDESPPPPPTLPETPLYPLLRTNTPHPTMTYPGFPFAPNTPLYPTHDFVQKYHEDFANRFNLTSAIKLNHSILAATYQARSKWTLSIRGNEGSLKNASYDHLIVASGHNHYPYIPEWDGAEEWERGAEDREIVHSIYYREPERYAGRTVIVVGFSASGSDMAIQVTPVARKLYHSYTNASDPLGRLREPIPGTIQKPRISHFDSNGIIFTDGSRLGTSGPTTILLGTGYQLVVPFLQPLVEVSQLSHRRSLHLSTNRRYIRALHRVIFAIDQNLPLDALAFVGLPVWIANAPSDFAQGLFLAHALAAPHKVLPTSKEEALRELEKSEDDVREHGNDPYWIGHRFATEGSAQDYQDDLVAHVQRRSPYPLPSRFANSSKPYVEKWRRAGRNETFLMRRGWLRAEESGLDKEFIQGAVTEQDWVEAMERITRWQKEYEENEGCDSRILGWTP
ncbi:FAD/NAD(P)-binding domain-containing protein, partial [Meredithblackwellia eburnea MCA 4105]